VDIYIYNDYNGYGCVFNKILNHLKPLKNAEMKLKNKIKWLSRYFNLIKMVNTWVKKFKIIFLKK
jgi:hypothetical protein